MKKLIQIAALFSLMMFFSFNSQAKDPEAKEKKVQSFKVSRTMPFSADKVWNNIANDYGAIAKSHPKIIKSEYIDGSVKGAKEWKESAISMKKAASF